MGGRGSAGTGLGWRDDGGRRHGVVAHYDRGGRARVATSGGGGAGGDAPASPRRWPEVFGGNRSGLVEGPGSPDRPADAWRSRVAFALDLQEHAASGHGTVSAAAPGQR